MKKVIVSLCVLVAIWGCRKVEFDPNLEKINENLLVVDAMITDDSNIQFVKLTRTSEYMSNETSLKVNNALVSVWHRDNEYVFTLSGNGIYQAPTGFIGQIGETYKLKIVDQGMTFEASSTMKPALIMDSISIEVDEFDKSKYSVKGWYHENPNQIDYHIIKYAINDVMNDSLVNWGLLNDVGIKGSHIEGGFLFNGIKAKIGDKLSVFSFSVDEKYNKFFQAAQSSLIEPVPFLPPPGAKIKGNISNGALGFFQASSVREKSRIVKKLSYTNK